ncbi:hypothetical protein D9619_009005 [Psilocybe cf. subviscida]|uniref:High nitrogen upregulated cytochrome P450 monooxygenase 2 n=1 Tax=Psilocybe cf. subviscida TaxID=2480587 RepID=A0A8H5FAA9_9AGAR|nr:hypothetical protein D9619_009005 [Psilocybe cf. subviscida]
MAAVVSHSNALLVTLFMAFLSHMKYRKHEPTSVTPVLLSILGLSVPSTLLLVPYYPNSPTKAFLLAVVTFSTGLLGCISFYRLSTLHPLAHYPGPIQCRLTKLWGAWIALDGQPHVYYKRLHDQYGPIVRVGPNELSIIDASMIPTVLGSNGMPKGPMWAGRRILPSKNHSAHNSLTAVRNFRRHAELRRPWNNAFRPSSVEGFTEMMVKRVDQLVEVLKERASATKGGRGIDLALWLNYFTFDFMGDLAFGGVYSFMEDGDIQGILPVMRRGIFVPSISQHVPWAVGLVHLVPFIGSNTLALARFGIEQAKKRVELTSSILRKDLFYYLFESVESQSTADPSLVLKKSVSSSLLVIVAGSDTTAAVLSNVFYYLLSHPEYYQRLREEIDALFPFTDANSSPVDVKAMNGLHLLNAVINEALRLQPPIPTSLQRAPAVGGGPKVLSDEITIPEGTAVVISPYVIHRSPHYFSPNPDKFWPERWISQDPGIITDRSAFIPFSTGQANCPGKPLAIVQLRYTIASIVRAFDAEFADGYDAARWEKELQDRYVVVKGELPVKLTSRKMEP